MSIKVLINGAFGRMGQMTAKAVSEHPSLELVGQTGREYDLKKAIKDSQAQVVVDFTHPDVVFKNTELIIASGARPVIGTSGLTAEKVKTLQEKCAELKLGGLVAPNFSLGGVLMMKYAREIARYLPDVEIIEMHHAGKLDSPSGTAMRTAELIADGAGKPLKPQKPAKENIPGARGAEYRGIPIHAIRLPGFLAHQEIIFGDTGETLTLRHDSIDRQCFMPGVCLACERVMTLDHMVYGLEEIL
jgi:4-hydroxy-tetrahydrodipicolinate reductase